MPRKSKLIAGPGRISKKGRLPNLWAISEMEKEIGPKNTRVILNELINPCKNYQDQVYNLRAKVEKAGGPRAFLANERRKLSRKKAKNN